MPLQPATPAPAFLDEVLARLEIKGAPRPVFLFFFRTDCPWCVAEMPQLSDVYARHPLLEVSGLGVAVGHDTLESAREFARTKGLKFPIYVDEGGALKSAFAIERVPSIVVIGGRGLVERTFQGTSEQLGGILEQTILATAEGAEPPDYNMIGNGCAP